jgi:hypothetical protein
MILHLSSECLRDFPSPSLSDSQGIPRRCFTIPCAKRQGRASFTSVDLQRFYGFHEPWTRHSPGGNAWWTLASRHGALLDSPAHIGGRPDCLKARREPAAPRDEATGGFRDPSRAGLGPLALAVHQSDEPGAALRWSSLRLDQSWGRTTEAAPSSRSMLPPTRTFLAEILHLKA